MNSHTFPSVPTAVIFDMDGTLLDTERLAVECWVQAFQQFSIDMPRWVIDSTVARSAHEKQQIFVDHLPASRRSLPPEEISEVWKAIFVARLRNGGIQAKPGAREMLLSLRERGIPAAVATSSSSLFATPFLQVTGLLPLLDVVVCGEDVEEVKPSPMLYLEAVRRLGVRAQDAWAVEDSSQGIESAVAAGIPVVHVPDLQIVSVAARRMAWKECATLTELDGFLDLLIRTEWGESQVDTSAEAA